MCGSGSVFRIRIREDPEFGYTTLRERNPFYLKICGAGAKQYEGAIAENSTLVLIEQKLLCKKKIYFSLKK